MGRTPKESTQPKEGKSGLRRSPATQGPHGSKGGSFPVTSAAGGGRPHASREKKKPVTKRERKRVPSVDGDLEAPSPSLECGRKEGQVREATCYPGRLGSPHPPPPPSSSPSARASETSARPRLRPPAPRSLLGTVVSASTPPLRRRPPGHVGGGAGKRAPPPRRVRCCLLTPAPSLSAIKGAQRF